MLNRNKIIEQLKENNIETRPLIAGNMANKPFWIKRYGHSTNLPNADIVDKQGFYVPNHQGLVKEDIEVIASIINQE
jgi:CDP-6-deoxy-D-xylo-4-hexulose-3-dehydrase